MRHDRFLSRLRTYCEHRGRRSAAADLHGTGRALKRSSGSTAQHTARHGSGASSAYRTRNAANSRLLPPPLRRRRPLMTYARVGPGK